MNEKEINEACARLDGWQEGTFGDKYIWRKNEKFRYNPPNNYITSYDAIIPLIQKEDTKAKVKILDRVLIDDFSNEFELDATPLQLATVLLKAKGLWKE